MDIDKTYQKKEIILQVKWLTIGIIACGLVGAIIGTAQVLFFEQTPGGRYAVHNECVLWDEGCIQGCEEAQYDNPQNPPSCEECCIKYKDLVDPLGNRISELAWRYGVLGGGIGVVVGLTIAEEKKRKLLQT